MTGNDSARDEPSSAGVESLQSRVPEFDRTPGRIVVVAMLLLFAAMASGLAELGFDQQAQFELRNGTDPNLAQMYRQFATLFGGIAWLCGIGWIPCLLFGIVMCAQNPRPPPVETLRDESPREEVSR